MMDDQRVSTSRSKALVVFTTTPSPNSPRSLASSMAASRSSRRRPETRALPTNSRTRLMRSVFKASTNCASLSESSVFPSAVSLAFSASTSGRTSTPALTDRLTTCGKHLSQSLCEIVERFVNQASGPHRIRLPSRWNGMFIAFSLISRCSSIVSQLLALSSVIIPT